MHLNVFQCGWLAFSLFLSPYYFNFLSLPFLFQWDHTKTVSEIRWSWLKIFPDALKKNLNVQKMESLHGAKKEKGLFILS